MANTNSKTSRNSLTIHMLKEILCAEHAARVLAAEAWWTIVPNKDDSFSQTGDAGKFWSVITAIKELGMPIGYTKSVNHLGRTVNEPHSDPELLLRTIIKPNGNLTPPNKELIQTRCKVSGKDFEATYKERVEQYEDALAAEMELIEKAIKSIMQQQPNMEEPLEGAFTQVFNEDTGTYEDVELSLPEHQIPIDRIIEFGERYMKSLANNSKVNDLIFGTENALWEGEINRLKQIVQQEEHEGAAPDYVAEMDDKLLDAAGMHAGSNSGK